MDQYMNTKKLTLNNLCLVFFTLLVSLSSQAQIIDWKDHPDKTYVFEISNKEAEKLLKTHPRDSVILKMLHTPVASFEKTWENPPAQGHFIYAEVLKNKVYYDYVPIMPFQVFLFKEYGVLTLQVIDAEGKVRNNAKVKIKGRWRFFDTGISFDKESQTYRIDDWSDKTDRILTVELDKFRAVFDLEKHMVRPWYGDHYRGGSSPQFYSYMITDKNKYKPGETVRFKSYALSDRKSPIKKDLQIWINTEGYQYKKIAKLAPYHPGGFAGEVQLHDSLELKLDKSYNIQLRNNEGRVVANANFRYEDYELYDNNMDVKLKDFTQYYPNNNQLEIKVADANGLILQDMKADIYIKRLNVSNIYTDVYLLPDTILHERVDLDNVEPTKFNIPVTLFGEADCTYEVEVLVLTIDNQRMVYQNTVPYFRSHRNLAYETRNDTIRFEYKELGKGENVKAKLRYGDSKEEKLIDLPYEEPFNQALRSYNFEVINSDYKSRIFSRNVNTELDLTGGIAADSFNVKLVNPLNLELSWYIYQGNILLQKGSGKEFDFKYPNTDLEVAHYVEIFYFMGDEEQVFRRVFVPKTEYLAVDIDLPERIYPGQKLDATITVKDNLNKPVKDVDLTAFSVNGLLNYGVPDLPYYGAAPRTREQRSSYSIDKREFNTFTGPLDYKYWNKMASLDTLKYYQFTYPRNEMFTYKVNTPDSTTQFAPYVMKNGKAVDIYVIELNGNPVYFSWTEQPQAYSFIAQGDTCENITLRLHDRAIILDSLYFEKGKKTILSIDVEHLPIEARVLKLDNKDQYKRHVFTEREKGVFNHYISSIPVKSSHTYLKQGDTIYHVYHTCLSPSMSRVLVGPVLESRTKYNDGIKYKHEGGFSYQFEENVVYKYPKRVYPEYLEFTSNNNFSQLNQFFLTPKVFNKLIDDCRAETKRWFPSSIYISQPKMNMNFKLPIEKDSTGVSNLLFKNRQTDKIHFPDKVENGVRKYSEIPRGIYDVVLLYNNGKYLKYDSIPLMMNAYIEVNLARQAQHEADSLSKKWLLLRTQPTEIGIVKPVYTHTNKLYTKTEFGRKSGNTVVGYIYDDTGEPLIGVSIQLKGTNYGAISDLDGRFEIDVTSSNDILKFSYIGFKPKEMNVAQGSEISVILEENFQMLDEVVVVAYGTQKKMSVLGSMTTVSSEGPAPQSPPEELDDVDDGGKTEVEDAEDRLYSELLQLNGLRANFSDVGFWEPALYTDKKGKAQFSVTFPDNITRWETVIYAMNRKLKTGTARKSIKSYKPLMAELKTPQFLVAGDSSYFAGNIRNYTKDKDIVGKIMFALEQDTLMNKNIDFTTSYHDKMLVTASVADSLSATYLFTRDDGYSDGELRSIPIEPQGTEIAEGALSFLRNGDKLNVQAGDGEDMHISITGKQLDVYMNATYYLTGYKYACNEQLASKLMGLLNYKIYKRYLGEKFKNDKEVNQIIKRLIDNRNDQKLWSWWGRSSNTSFWMSAHIMRALRMAKEDGYTVNLDLTKIEQDYMDTKSYRNMSLYDIETLHALSEYGTKQNYAAAVNMFEKEIRNREIREDSIAKKWKYYNKNSYLKEKLLLWEIRQMQNLKYSSDSISKYLKKDVLGLTHCGDGRERSWYADNLATTLIAYRIIKRDSTLLHYKEPMQMYILGTKRTGWNTYQASSAVSTILPDLISESATKQNPATVMLDGKENKELTKFPYTTQLTAGEKLGIEKIDGMPLIYSAYTIRRVTKEQIGEAFEVTTSFRNIGDTLNIGDILTAGKPIVLNVKVKVKQKNAEHVMIEVPLPAGCSYASKSSYYYRGYEVHREHFKEKTVIFCEKLPEGDYEYNIELLPRYTGRYNMNPAKVEMMYFPVINANNDMKKVEIEDKN